MSAPIGPSNSSAVGLNQAEDASRPQVQSRRVSLKLGPFGITYATDQVLWTAAAAQIAATPNSGAGAFPTATTVSPFDAADATTAETIAASQAEAQQEAQQSGRTFNQEFLDAWRRQIAEQERTTGTYGPDGVLARGENGAAGAKVEAIAEEAGADAKQAEGRSAQEPGVPATRVRKAIAAYLSCARDFGAARPMLTAVA